MHSRAGAKLAGFPRPEGEQGVRPLTAGSVDVAEKKTALHSDPPDSELLCERRYLVSVGVWDGRHWVSPHAHIKPPSRNQRRRTLPVVFAATASFRAALVPVVTGKVG